MRIRLLFCLCLLTPVLTQAQKLRLAVAANAQFVVKQLQVAFEKKTGIKSELVVSSSGKLTAQIRQGAPFDVFLSADSKYPQVLYQEGLTTKAPDIYARGMLVLWTLKPEFLTNGLNSVTSPKVKRVAIGNPKTAPYGEATLQTLQHLKINQEVHAKLVYGESLSQVNQYLLAGAADMAFTAKSVVLDPALKGQGKWLEVDPKLYTPISQGVVILKSSKGQQLKQALSFYQFLFSPQGRAIFKAYGYH